MTEQIKSAIADFQEWIDRAEEFNPNVQSDHVKAMKLVIHSLQAWDEVLQELEDFDEREYLKDEGHRFGCNWGICYAIELINQHLAEIEE